MLKSNWRTYAATGGLAALALVFAVWGVMSWVSQHHRHASERHETIAERAQNSGEYGQAACIHISGFPGVVCGFEQPDHNEERRAAYDLHAQQDMAEFAFLMFVVGGVGALITLAGVVYVAWTLGETRKANIGFAEHSKRELRAYVKVECDSGKVAAGELVEFKFLISNYGKTPAYKVATSAVTVVRPKGWSWDQEVLEVHEAERPSNIIHPTDKIMTLGCLTDDDGSAISLPERIFDGVKADNACVYSRVIVLYEDAFDDPHETEFRFEFSGAHCFKSGKPRLSSEGNRAT